jgi:hypothetical protein
MRKYTLLFLLIWGGFTVSAQQPHYKSIFGSQSTSWETAWDNINGTTRSTIYVQKDTVVNGLAYKKLVSNSLPYKPGLIREDTISGKVWYRQILPDDPAPFTDPIDTLEMLALNFGLSVGDTFDINGAGYWMSSPVPDSFNVVKRIYFQYGLKYIEFKGPAVEPFTMIEGIGSNFGVVWKKQKTFMRAQYLLCSYKNGVKTPYTNIQYNGFCNVNGTNGLSENMGQQIELGQSYPNPTTEAAIIPYNLPVSSKNAQLIIRDITGREVGNYALKKNSSSLEINLSNLHNGLYTYSLIADGKPVATKKLAVMK